MPRIHVCSLSRMSATVAAAGASHLVTLINSGTPVERPGSIPAERHLMLGVSDIVAPIEGLVPPTEHHIRDLVAFVDRLGSGAAAGDPLLCRDKPLDGRGLYYSLPACAGSVRGGYRRSAAASFAGRIAEPTLG